MSVKEIMSSPVVCTKNEVKISHIKDQFSRKGIHAIPVLEDDGTISGIISSSDLVACHDESLTAADIKSPKVHIAIPNHRIQDAANMMLKNDWHHLVVMEEGEVIGMVSTMDIIRYYVENQH